MIELPRRMRTYPTFYVCRLRQYYQHEVSSSGVYNWHAQESAKDSCDSKSSSQYDSELTTSGDELTPHRHEWLDALALYPIVITPALINHPTDGGRTAVPAPSNQDSHVSLDRSDHVIGGGFDQDDQSTIPLPTDVSKMIFLPITHPLLDSHRGQRFHVERILNHHDVSGQRTKYLVHWRGYPPSHDSWEPRAQLMFYVEGLVH